MKVYDSGCGAAHNGEAHQRSTPVQYLQRAALSSRNLSCTPPSVADLPASTPQMISDKHRRSLARKVVQYKYSSLIVQSYTQIYTQIYTQADDRSSVKTTKMGSFTPLSSFSHLRSVPLDAIYSLKETFLADSNENKIILGSGVYRDDQSQPWVLPSVQKVRISYVLVDILELSK